jgi:hypothetical protein
MYFTRDWEEALAADRRRREAEARALKPDPAYRARLEQAARLRRRFDELHAERSARLAT